MFQPLRFGRRLTIPSKRQIIHEMRMLEAEEIRLKTMAPGAQALISDKAEAPALPTQ